MQAPVLGRIDHADLRDKGIGIGLHTVDSGAQHLHLIGEFA